MMIDIMHIERSLSFDNEYRKFADISMRLHSGLMALKLLQNDNFSKFHFPIDLIKLVCISRDSRNMELKADFPTKLIEIAKKHISFNELEKLSKLIDIPLNINNLQDFILTTIPLLDKFAIVIDDYSSYLFEESTKIKH